MLHRLSALILQAPPLDSVQEVLSTFTCPHTRLEHLHKENDECEAVSCQESINCGTKIC